MTSFLMDDMAAINNTMEPTIDDDIDALLYGSGSPSAGNATTSTRGDPYGSTTAAGGAPGSASGSMGSTVQLPDMWRETDAQLTARLSSMQLDALPVRELKVELKALGMPTYGSRVQLLQRLQEAVRVLQQQHGMEGVAAGDAAAVGPAVGVEYAEEAARLVMGMPQRQLQEELRQRGVEPRGTKSLMQDVLQQLIMKEMATLQASTGSPYAVVCVLCRGVGCFFVNVGVGMRGDVYDGWLVNACRGCVHGCTLHSIHVKPHPTTPGGGRFWCSRYRRRQPPTPRGPPSQHCSRLYPTHPPTRARGTGQAAVQHHPQQYRGRQQQWRGRGAL